MANDAKGTFDHIKGLKKANPEEFAQFKKAMSDKVIPKIVKKVEARRLRAAKNRNRRLKD